MDRTRRGERGMIITLDEIVSLYSTAMILAVMAGYLVVKKR